MVLSAKCFREKRVVELILALLVTLYPLPAAWAVEKDAASQLSVTSDPDAVASLLQVTAGLVVVLLIIFVAAGLIKRFGSFQKTAGGALKVLGALSIGPKERVVLMQVGDTQLLLGVAPGRVERLHVLDTPIEIEIDKPGETDNFSARLRTALIERARS